MVSYSACVFLWAFSQQQSTYYNELSWWKPVEQHFEASFHRNSFTGFLFHLIHPIICSWKIRLQIRCYQGCIHSMWLGLLFFPRCHVSWKIIFRHLSIYAYQHCHHDIVFKTATVLLSLMPNTQEIRKVPIQTWIMTFSQCSMWRMNRALWLLALSQPTGWWQYYTHPTRCTLRCAGSSPSNRTKPFQQTLICFVYPRVMQSPPILLRLLKSKKYDGQER